MQYLSFVTFLHTQVQYPNQRQQFEFFDFHTLLEESLYPSPTRREGKSQEKGGGRTPKVGKRKSPCSALISIVQYPSSPAHRQGQGRGGKRGVDQRKRSEGMRNQKMGGIGDRQGGDFYNEDDE